MKARFQKIAQAGSSQQIKGRLKNIEGATLGHAHRFIISRWKNLQEVRRHAGGWLLLVILLSVAVIWQGAQASKLYTAEIPGEGTTYTEGVTGTVENINPIFASTQAERSAARLLFTSLFTYDERNQLVSELAQRWTVDASGKVYTVSLRQDARWHDGAAINADDVLFTFNTIKNVETKSPYYSSWRTITIEKADEYTVRFNLPAPYAPFLNSLTLGILPEHILNQLRPAELRNNAYNRNPTVASGPFIFQDMRALDSKRLHYMLRFNANQDYFLGAPKLGRFNMHTYADREQLLQAFRSQEVAAINDATTQQLESISGQSNVHIINAPLFNGVYAFFKLTNPLTQDLKVRQALVLATDQTALIKKLNDRVEPVTGPLISGQLGYRPGVAQGAFNTTLAAQLLDQAGWVVGADGKRAKDGQPLRLRLVALSTGDYPIVAQELMNQWAKLGVSFDSQLIKPDDFQQNVIFPRAYDVLIYELALGRDSDQFAYWHSSQANERGFNLSDYKSPRADDALDSARSRLDPALREAKYQSFVQQWLADVPAIGLYRPTLSYVQNKNLTSFTDHPLVEQTDRYYNVRYWSASKDELRPTR